MAVATLPNAQTKFVDEVRHEQEMIGRLMEESVRVVSLCFRGRPGNRKVRGTKVMLGDDELDRELFSGSTIRVLPLMWNKKLSAVETKARRWLSAVSPNLPMGSLLPKGCDLVRAERLDDLGIRIASLNEQELQPLLEDLVSDWPDIKERMRKKLIDASAYEDLAKRLPNEGHLRAIRLEFFRWPITFITEAGSELARELSRSVIESFAEDLQAALDHFNEMVKKGSTFKSASVAQIKEIFGRIKEFDFLASPAVAEQLQKASYQFDQLGDNGYQTINRDLQSQSKLIVKGLQQAFHGLSAAVKAEINYAEGPARRTMEV